MSTTLDASLLLPLFGGSSQTTSSSSSSSSGSSTSSTTAAKKVVPTAPWDTSSTAPKMSDLTKGVLAGKRFIDINAAQLDVKGASDDYRKIFALYQGFNALYGVADQANAKGIGATRLAQLEKTFNAGLSEINGYLDTLKLDKLRMTAGGSMTEDKATVGAAKDATSYTTDVIYTGPSTGTPDAFQGDVKFDIALKHGTSTQTVSIDLSEMGATTRTMGNVVAYINSKLQAAGAGTRFSVVHTPGEPRTVQAGGKPITLPAGPDQWAMTVTGDSAEQVTFSAPATAASVYVAQNSGKDTLTHQLLKFQTDISQTADAPPATLNPPGQLYSMDGRAYSQDLGPNIAAVHATATGPDGSVYVLADVTGTVNGQPIQGAQDAALLKYDSAGNLVSTRTLGAAGSAQGLALAVSADGKVAIAGSVTGVLNPGDAGSDPKASDSFVTVFDKDGQELWTQRRGALKDDQANQVAFAADGSVYIAGTASSAVPGAQALGGSDGYLQGFDATGKAKFSVQFGGAGADKATALTVDGSSLVVAGTDGTHGVVRRFDLQASGPPTAAGVRDLGDLQGGTIAGVAVDNGQIVVSGSTANGSLSAGTVTAAYSGSGSDAFAAKIASNLQASASDRVAFLGGSGADKATALAVSNGQVWIAGTSTGPLAGQNAIGAQDGFLARLNVDTGQVEWSRRFTSDDHQAAPASIAVDATGSSVLDRLGLPKGSLGFTLPATQSVDAESTRVTAATSARAGDQFYVKTGEGSPAVAVTISDTDTFASLALKVNRALGFQGQASVVLNGSIKTLQIKPLNGRSSVEIEPGKPGKDALAALGLQAGVVQQTPDSTDKTAKKTYGLGFDSNIDISTPDRVKAAQQEILATMAVVRSAYRDLQTAANPKPKSTATGPVPQYLQSQIANYQAALNRLTGGS